MRFHSPRTLAVLFVLFFAVLSDTQAGQTVRVVSWNLKWFPGGSPTATEEEKKVQMAAAQAAIKTLNPDIVLLQEVADFDAVEQLLSVLPGFKVGIVSHFPPKPQNVAIASRFLADSAWAEKWKKDGVDDPPRGFAFAAIKLPNDRLLLAYSVHFKSNLGDMPEDIAMREESVRQILPHAQAMMDLYSKRGEAALVIGGDFNTSFEGEQFKTERTLAALRDAGFNWSHEGVPLEQRLTIPKSGGHPASTFDHIFSSGFGKPVAKVIQIKDVSDHNPVVLDLDIGERSLVALHPEKAKLPESEVIPIKVVPASTDTVFAPNEKEKLASVIGKEATVRGTVSSIARVGMRSIGLINFSDSKRGDFVALVKGPRVREVALKHGGSLTQLKGREIEVTGTVTDYKGTPQIELLDAGQLRVTR